MRPIRSTQALQRWERREGQILDILDARLGDFELIARSTVFAESDRAAVAIVAS